jgi:hypothetical protein
MSAKPLEIRCKIAGKDLRNDDRLYWCVPISFYSSARLDYYQEADPCFVARTRRSSTSRALQRRFPLSSAITWHRGPPSPRSTSSQLDLTLLSNSFGPTSLGANLSWRLSTKRPWPSSFTPLFSWRLTGLHFTFRLTSNEMEKSSSLYWKAPRSTRSRITVIFAHDGRRFSLSSSAVPGTTTCWRKGQLTFIGRLARAYGRGRWQSRGSPIRGRTFKGGSDTRLIRSPRFST